MSVVITGISRFDSSQIEEVLGGFDYRLRQMRHTHALERFAIAAIGSALVDAGVVFPVGDSSIGMYIGIDDAIEDIKDEYFNGILIDGIPGASPRLFPYTSPNALTAQVSIAFDLRGESIMIPINYSCSEVLKYAANCVTGQYVNMAIAGCIKIKDYNVSANEGRYASKIFVFEEEENAMRRNRNMPFHRGGNF